MTMCAMWVTVSCLAGRLCDVLSGSPGQCSQGLMALLTVALEPVLAWTNQYPSEHGFVTG